MTRSDISKNIHFRVAIADKKRKTSEIACTFGISQSHCRDLRKKFGVRCNQRLPHGYVTKGDWMQNADLVHDVKMLQCKEVVAKHGIGQNSVMAMRKQLGIGKQQIVASKEFRKAIKTMKVAAVAEIYKIGRTTVIKYRRIFGDTKTNIVQMHNV